VTKTRNVQRLLLVFLGSGLGGSARYLIGTWVANVFGVAFPYGTIAINTIGSFFIVVVTQLAARGTITDHVRLALTTGVLGGFTTYSSFNNETMYFLQRGSVGLAPLNHGVTILLCLVAGALGFLVMR